MASSMSSIPASSRYVLLYKASYRSTDRAQIKTFNPRTCMDVLSVVPCSLASANQRAGRAGRTSAGKCFRLYPSSLLPTHNPQSPMPVQTPPEITRSDISLYLLQLKALGIDNLAKFDFMTAPPSEMMIRALEFLFSLKAIDDEGRLTKPMGERMAEVPLDPMMAAIVSVQLLLRLL